MKKNYIRPQTETIGLGTTMHLLTLSIGENADINVYTDESQPAEGAMTKENPFTFEWE